MGGSFLPVERIGLWIYSIELLLTFTSIFVTLTFTIYPATDHHPKRSDQIRLPTERGRFSCVISEVLLRFAQMKKSNQMKPGIKHKVLRPGRRRYTISISPGYSREKLNPLILVLHYDGHGSAFFGELILLGLIEPAFKELDPIIVAPDCPSRDWTQPESERLVIDLLDSLPAEYNIDPERILITGYSLGGMGTWHFAARYPERFRAAIIMAGRPPENVSAIDWQIPLMVIHGRNDEIVPINATNNAVFALEERNVDITFRVLEGVTHYETHYFVGALQSAIPWLQERWGKT